MSKKSFIYVGLFLFLGLSGCVSRQLNNNQKEDSMLESYNRAMFSINRQLDNYIMRPVVKGYKKVTNETVRKGVKNFFSNIKEPISAVNHLFQGDLASSGNNLGRFAVNTVFGGVGLFDVATVMGMEANKTGFDETLSNWCVPDGPYIVLPVIGPSTPRAFAGFAVDSYSSPIYWATTESSSDNAPIIYYGLSGLEYTNILAENINLLESLEEGAIDYYEAVKSTYLQNRNKLKNCKTNANTIENLNYDFDMDE